MNKEEHETKDEQIVERTSFQRICDIWSRTQKQHESIHEKKTLWRVLEKWDNRKKSEKFSHFHLDVVKWVWFENKHCVLTKRRFMTKTFQKLWILQYNVHKSRSKIIITLLHEKRIKNYDILMIQKSWRYHEGTKTYNSCDTDFTLKNNGKKTYFYINNRINDNNWHSTWHFKNVKIIILQLRSQNEKFSQDSMNTHKICSMNIHKMYNSSSINYNEVSSRRSLFVLKQTLSMSNENVIMSDFNLHHSHWSESSYFRQYLLLNDLLIVMRFISAIFSLLKNTIIKNY